MKNHSLKKSLLLFVFLLSTGFANAQTWQTVGTGADNSVYTLGSFNGCLVAGGIFTTMNGQTNRIIALYCDDGSGSYYWGSNIPVGLTYSPSGGPYAGMYIRATGQLYSYLHIGGVFTQSFYFTSQNGGYLTYDSLFTQWDYNAYYSEVPQDVFAMQVFNNKIYIGGPFSNWVGINYIASMDSGSNAPQSVGDALNGYVSCFTVYNNNLYAGGSFTTAGTATVNHIAKWDGTTWTPLDDGTSGTLSSLCVYNGNLIAGGTFTSASGTAVNNIAQWDGTTWSRLGSGLTGSITSVKALEVYNNNLYAAGSFSTAGSTTVHNIARWNGTTWDAVGGGTNGTVWALKNYFGKLFVGGEFTYVDSTLVASYIAELSGVVGINEINDNSPFSVSTLVSDVLYLRAIKSPIPFSFEIFSAEGKLIKSMNNLYDKYAVNVSDIKSGIYIVRIRTDKGDYTSKFVKE